MSLRTIHFHFFGKSEQFGLYPTYYNLSVYSNMTIRKRTPPPPRCGENVLKELPHSACYTYPVTMGPRSGVQQPAVTKKRNRL